MIICAVFITNQSRVNLNTINMSFLTNIFYLNDTKIDFKLFWGNKITSLCYLLSNIYRQMMKFYNKYDS